MCSNHSYLLLSCCVPGAIDMMLGREVAGGGVPTLVIFPKRCLDGFMASLLLLQRCRIKLCKIDVGCANLSILLESGISLFPFVNCK